MTGQTRIRVARVDDGPDLAEIYAPIVRDTSISFEEVPPTADEMSRRIESTLRTHPWLVAEDAGTAIAYAYAAAHRVRAAYRWSCDVSVYVAEGSRRAGLAQDLYAQLIRTLINLGFGSAFAGITLPNEASVGFHKRMGFELVGVYRRVGFKNGDWRDVGWWSRPLQTLDDQPTEPLAFAANLRAFEDIRS